MTVLPKPTDATTSIPSSGILERMHEWVTSVDHKKLGMMYIFAGIFFFMIGGIEAGIIRYQLAWAANGAVGPEVYNQMFTMHGTTMVFLVGMPVLLGFGNYLIPLMIGARDMAFPRLNAWGFWVFLFGGLLLYFSFIASSGLFGSAGAPDVGWFAYSPLTSRAFNRGNNVDYWILGILISGFGSMATGINLIVTILCLRCKGMSLMRMPIMVWSMLVTGFLVMIAIPVLTAAQVMLLFDRFLGAHFFDPQLEGSALLWQHLFWFFGHPEVYILIIPAFGFISEIIPVFSRKVIFGYTMMVIALVWIAFQSMGVWAHHMFAVGLPPSLNAFFAASTFLIAVPTGIKIFNWIGTIWGGRVIMKTPMLFALGFVGLFVIGGLTGIMLATVPFDWDVSDSYFVVGHFHYVLFGGTLFAIFGAIYFWFPKMSGRMLGERLGKWHFWLLFIGMNLTFGPMHISGILGMPRRIYTYAPDRGLDIWNLLTTVGYMIQVIAILVFTWNLIVSWRKGKRAGDDPWDAWTLEWATTSPPQPWNFHPLPKVKSRRPLWDAKHPEDPDYEYE